MGAPFVIIPTMHLASLYFAFDAARLGRFILLAARQLAIAGVAAGLLFATLRRRHPAWLVLLGVTLALAIYTLNPIARVYSNHGLFHTANVYRVIAGGVPPTNPLFAGVPLRYPWVHYVIVAALVRRLDMPPPTIFAALNVALLTATLLLVWAIARRLSDERVARVFSVALSLFAVSLFEGTVLGEVLTRVIPVGLDSRGIPPEAKFLNVNSMPLGIACFALFLLALLRRFEGSHHAAGDWVLLCLAVAGAGYLYPVLWAATLACGVLCSAVLLACRRPSALTAAWQVICALVVGTLASVPYFLELTGGPTDHTPLAPLVQPANFLRLLCAMLPLGLVLLVERRTVERVFRERMEPAILVATATVALSMLFVLRLEPLSFHYDYKFLSLALFCLGILAGPAFAALYARRKAIAFLALSALLLPFAADLLPRFVMHRPVRDPFYEEGSSLRHADPDQDALYRWIAHRTPADAWFLDTQLSIPVFARRQLYVGLEDRRRVQPTGGRPANGWLPSVWVDLAQTNRYPAAWVHARQSAAAAFFDPSKAGVPATARTRILREAGRHPVFVVARRPTIARKLASDAGCRRVYSRGGVAVFHLLPAPQPPAPEAPGSACGGAAPRSTNGDRPPARRARLPLDQPTQHDPGRGGTTACLCATSPTRRDGSPTTGRSRASDPTASSTIPSRVGSPATTPTS